MAIDLRIDRQDTGDLADFSMSAGISPVMWG
jgi:hypothetical protein